MLQIKVMTLEADENIAINKKHAQHCNVQEPQNHDTTSEGITSS